MSGLNASLGYFVASVIFVITVQILFKKWPRLSFLSEFSSAFMLVACWLEVQTIVEIGQWAGGLGPDVTVTILFVMVLTHGVICGSASGNPSLTLMKFLQLETSILATVLALVAQFAGAYFGLVVAQYYWNLELTDMHMIKNLMYGECSTSLRVSVLQGFFTESTCALIFYLIYLKLSHRSAFIRVPLIALLFTFLSYTARDYTSAYINPSLAYGLTFYCPGFTLRQYVVVYWLGPLTGMMVALLLYMGHIPRIFAKNLLYSQKTRFKGPKVETGGKKNI